MNYAKKENAPAALYSFGLPGVEPSARFTCVLCGAPAISEIELYDEVICDLCYEKESKLREEADDQYCCEKRCPIQIGPDCEKIFCDGKCTGCLL